MRLDPVPGSKNWKAPHWFKRHPVSLIYYIEEFKADAFPRRICRSTGESRSRELALKIAEKIRHKWLGNQLETKNTRVLMRDLCNEVLVNQRAKFERKKIRAGTLENAEVYLPYIADAFGAYTPDKMTEALWNRFCSDYHAKHPGKSLLNHWSYMGMVMGYAFKGGHIKRAWNVEKPDPKKESGRVLTPEEIGAIYAAASPDLRDQLLFATTMGMRLREHLYLAWEQVDLEARTVTVLAANNKNGKQRTVRVSPQVFQMLERRHAVRGRSEFVFPSKGRTDKPVEDNKSAWTAAKRRARIVGRCRYHDLRHTFVSECAKLVRESRVSVVLICAYVDMSIRVFEKVYLHLNYQDTAAVAELIAVNVR